MIILSLLAHNFRKYEHNRFNFNDKFTALIGNNGAGKSTILDALAIMLNTYFQGSKIPSAGGNIKKGDHRLIYVEKGGEVFAETPEDVWLNATGLFHGKEIEWLRESGDRGRKAKEIVSIGSTHRREIKSGGSPDLPLLIYYGAGRLWDTHYNMDTEAPTSQLDAYRYCLDPKSDQKAFFKWLKKATLVGLQKRIDSDALKAVKNAILTCTPGAEDFYFDIDYNEAFLELEREGKTPITNLSDGYRCMVSMVGDIAHRASRLNPHFGADAAKKTKGIVMIDELDLHLHPKWQRRVVEDLKAAFPEVQFIVSTHSPFILQSLEPGEVIDLDRKLSADIVESAPPKMAMPSPTQKFSDRALEDIVEDVMQIEMPQRSERQQKMFDAAKEYYAVLEQANNASEEKKQELKDRLDELSSPFSENVAYHAFLEMERVAAGLGKSKNNTPPQTDSSEAE